jgi:hypothetical protein
MVVVCLTLLLLASSELTSPQPIPLDERVRFSTERIVASHTSTVVADEYKPKWVAEPPAYAGLGIEGRGYRIARGDADVQEIVRKSTMRAYSIAGRTDVLLQIASIDFPGWVAILDGQRIHHDHDNPWGLIQVSIPQGQHELILRFGNSRIRTVGTTISLLSITGFIGLVIWRGWRRVRE